MWNKENDPLDGFFESFGAFWLIAVSLSVISALATVGLIGTVIYLLLKNFG